MKNNISDKSGDSKHSLDIPSKNDKLGPIQSDSTNFDSDEKENFGRFALQWRDVNFTIKA
jgi:hypothetical protein